MKQQKGLTIVGYIIGIIFSIISIVRYYFLWQDIDRLITYVGIGIMICAIAWLFNENDKNQKDIEAIENYLSDVNDIKREGR